MKKHEQKKPIAQLFNDSLKKTQSEGSKAIGQTQINQLLDMYRCHMRFGTSLGSYLSRMHRAFPEWNIADNHVALFKFIDDRCGDFSKLEGGAS